MMLRPTSRDWLRDRNLLNSTDQQDDIVVSPTEMKYLLVVLTQRPRRVPTDIQEWLTDQPLVMPPVPGMQ